jgi:hypothetical protein
VLHLSTAVGGPGWVHSGECSVTRSVTRRGSCVPHPPGVRNGSGTNGCCIDPQCHSCMMGAAWATIFRHVFRGACAQPCVCDLTCGGEGGLLRMSSWLIAWCTTAYMQFEVAAYHISSTCRLCSSTRNAWQGCKILTTQFGPCMCTSAHQLSLQWYITWLPMQLSSQKYLKTSAMTDLCVFNMTPLFRALVS